MKTNSPTNKEKTIYNSKLNNKNMPEWWFNTQLNIYLRHYGKLTILKRSLFKILCFLWTYLLIYSK